MAIATPVKPDIQPTTLPDNQPDRTEQAIQLLASPDAFARWLLDPARGAWVGYSRISNECPLATWLTESLDHTVRVSSSIFGVDGSFRHPSLPEWAQRFVKHVDAHPLNRRITASDALALLDQSVRS